MIVFSHDDGFLADCCAKIAAGELKTLQLRRLMTGPVLDTWDSTAPRNQLIQDHQRLKAFLADGETDPVAMRGIAGKIRLLLEGHLRGRFVGRFADNIWLGDMIGVLRENQATLAEGPALPDELSLINEYSRRYHHSNPHADTEPIDETELRSWVERALAIADGF